MRRGFVIFYLKNHENSNAIRRVAPCSPRVLHLNYTQAADSYIEPAAVISGLPLLLVRQSVSVGKWRAVEAFLFKIINVNQELKQ